MRYRKLSATGDYTFGNGQLDFYRDVPQAPAQAVKTRLLLWLGEWFLDVESGTPFMQGIFGKHEDLQNRANTTIQDRTLQTEGVTGIQNYESVFDGDTRGFAVRFDLDTIYGPTQVDLENYGNY